jgi:hypothetical protein
MKPPTSEQRDAYVSVIAALSGSHPDSVRKHLDGQPIRGAAVRQRIAETIALYDEMLVALAEKRDRETVARARAITETA